LNDGKNNNTTNQTRQMKSNMQITNGLMIAVVAALMTGGAPAQTTTLIDPGTGAGDDIKNGGFESGTGAGNRTFANIDDWFNYHVSGDGMIGAGGPGNNPSFARTGTYGGSVSRSSVGTSHPAVDTGHTIALGDQFSLTFWYRDHFAWDADDTVTATLYSTTGNIWSGTVTPTTTWTSFTANNIAAANIGETLFLRFQASTLDVNEFSAIDDITLTVSPITPTPPVIVTLNPADGATTADPSANLTATFNNNIQMGTGNITLKKSADNSEVETFDVATSPCVTVSGATLTIDPTSSLDAFTGYYVEIAATAVKDMANNAFAGIADTTTWNFTTIDQIPTTTTVVSSGSPTTYGDSVTFTATVNPVPTGGTVQFYNGIDDMGSPVTVNTTTGVATVSTSTLGVVGPNEITAEYQGSGLYDPSTSASISQEVSKAPLTVTALNAFRFPNTANPDPLPYEITGYQNGQTLGTSGVTGTPALSTTAVLASPVGAYPITGTVGTLAADNYSFTVVAATLDVVNYRPLISPGTGASDDIKNGGFESGSTGSLPNYTVVADWFNSGGGTGVVAAGNDRERTGAYGGSVALTGTGASHPAVNTSHTIALGDTFSLTFYHGYAEDWDVGTDTIGVFLYSTAGVIWSTTVTPSQNALTGNFDIFTANNIPAANIGETLFLRFETNGSLNEFAAIDDVTLTVSPIPTGGFDAWASANGATGQTSQQDHDNDGVENGIEYFMGETGSSFTAMPGLDATNTVTWPMDAAYSGTYEVQTSPDLVTWTNVDPRPTPSGGTLSYTLPTGAPGGKSFVRLLVTPTP
jgi:hypothetical protein